MLARFVSPKNKKSKDESYGCNLQKLLPISTLEALNDISNKNKRNEGTISLNNSSIKSKGSSMPNNNTNSATRS